MLDVQLDVLHAVEAPVLGVLQDISYLVVYVDPALQGVLLVHLIVEVAIHVLLVLKITI